MPFTKGDDAHTIEQQKGEKKQKKKCLVYRNITDYNDRAQQILSDNSVESTVIHLLFNVICNIYKTLECN